MSLQADCNVILLMFNTMGGSTWSPPWDGWNPATACCDWYGIECVPFLEGGINVTRVRAVSLDHHGVTGTIPNEIRKLTYLESIRLRWSNDLSGTIPDGLGNLHRMQEITIGRNKVSGTIPFSLYNLKTLKQAYFKQSKLSGTLSEAIGGWSQLEVLNIKEANFEGTLPTALSTLHHLSVLDIEDNAWRGNLPQLPYGITKCELTDRRHGTPFADRMSTPMQASSLGKNANFNCPLPSDLPEACHSTAYCIIDPSEGSGKDQAILLDIYNALGKSLAFPKWDVNKPEGFRNWKGITEKGKRVTSINLANYDGYIRGTLPPSISGLDHLESLRLSSTSHLSGTLPEDIGMLSKLETLSVDKTKLSGTLPFSLYGLSKLRTLDAKQTKIGGSLSKGIAALSSLRTLDVSQSSFTGTLPVEMTYLTHLGTMRLKDNGWRGFLPILPHSIDECDLTDLTFETPYAERRAVPHARAPQSSKPSFDCPLPPSMPRACKASAYCTSPPAKIEDTPYAAYAKIDVKPAPSSPAAWPPAPRLDKFVEVA